MPSILRAVVFLPVLVPLLSLQWTLSHGFADTIALFSSSSSLSAESRGVYQPTLSTFGRRHDHRGSPLSASASQKDTYLDATAKVALDSSPSPPLSFRVGIIGSGSIAYGTASLLSSLGHESMIWSPSGMSAPKPCGMAPSTTVQDFVKTTATTTAPTLTLDSSAVDTLAEIQSTGAIETTFNARIAHSPDELVRRNDEVLIMALPANGHRGVMDTLSPVIVDHLFDRCAELQKNEVNDNPSAPSSPAMHIIISSHASLGAVYFLQSLKEECHKRHLDSAILLEGVRITAWGTTAVTARKTSDNSVRVLTVRQSVDYCTVPSSTYSPSSEEHPTTITTTTASTSTSTVTRRQELVLRNDGYELCTTLFGPRFKHRKGGLLAISLSNLNPQNHLGIVLGNMSRMDPPPPPPPLSTTLTSLQTQPTSFPTWYQGQNITPNVGRLMEALDRERIEIAKALGIDVRTIYEHFSWSFHVPMETPLEDDVDDDVDDEDSSVKKTMSANPSSSSTASPKMRPLTVSEMNQQMHHYLKNDVLGPTTPNSRYVLEDVPYGLVLTLLLGQLTNKPAILHESGIRILSAMYGRNFMKENELLHGLGLLNVGDDENEEDSTRMIPSLEKWKEMACTGMFRD